jgi:hypothetical protein
VGMDGNGAAASVSGSVIVPTHLWHFRFGSRHTSGWGAAAPAVLQRPCSRASFRARAGQRGRLLDAAIDESAACEIAKSASATVQGAVFGGLALPARRDAERRFWSRGSGWLGSSPRRCFGFGVARRRTMWSSWSPSTSCIPWAWASSCACGVKLARPEVLVCAVGCRSVTVRIRVGANSHEEV